MFAINNWDIWNVCIFFFNLQEKLRTFEKWNWQSMEATLRSSVRKIMIRSWKLTTFCVFLHIHLKSKYLMKRSALNFLSLKKKSFIHFFRLMWFEPFSYILFSPSCGCGCGLSLNVILSCRLFSLTISSQA